uniref:Mesothelin a n=1 Tax=Xiphophorus maculatus TaxID=8083 RepID=M3ZMI7_XIPMA
MMSAPNIVQQIFVTQILSVNSTGEAIIQNVPDEMATEIPRVFLQSFTAGSITNLSSSVLQGFTCTSVRTIEKAQVKKLVKACRRKGTDKVKLVESQLTCMFNRIRGEPDITSFDLFPPDVLLYYDYSLVSQSNCSFYFEQLSDADFSVFSSELSYKRTALFDNARNCLGITTTNLTKAQITVLGNMCCYLNASYILNSDESILEKLKTCPDLSAAQAAAVQTRLTGGTSRYRLASTWTETTLRNLDTFPLYMSSDFYDNFDKVSHCFKNDPIGAMKAEIRQSISSRLKRQTVTECTAGVITKVTIYNTTFPFDYPNINQFNSCLSAAVVRDNLEVITQKVHQQDYLKIVLSKLTTVPEDQVQVLGPASRVASADQINTWNITQVDTLASLMDTTNGPLDPSLAKAIISKYLSVEGNKLESAELNAIGGPNLCSVNTEVLGNISQQSLREANALDVSNCTSDKLKVLFNIALQAFQTNSRASVALYQFIQPYLGEQTHTHTHTHTPTHPHANLQQ